MIYIIKILWEIHNFLIKNSFQRGFSHFLAVSVFKRIFIKTAFSGQKIIGIRNNLLRNTDTVRPGSGTLHYVHDRGSVGVDENGNEVIVGKPYKYCDRSF